eukprot:15480384-Alexandrium_andersonii.AAC.1
MPPEKPSLLPFRPSRTPSFQRHPSGICAAFERQSSSPAARHHADLKGPRTAPFESGFGRAAGFLDKRSTAAQVPLKCCS